MSDVPDQVAAAVAVIQRAVPTEVLLGIHLYGSSIVGGLRPDSDLDLLVVTGRELRHSEKRMLVDGFLPVSGTRHGLRPLEVTVVARPEIVPWRYPPRMDLQYGEWMRDELTDATATLDTVAAPDLAIVLAMARDTAVPLVGAPLHDLVEEVPIDDLRRAMTDELPSLVDELEDDTRNVLLTLARIWVTMATGTIRSKAEAADWVAHRLPPDEAAVMRRANDLYIGGGFGPWDDIEAIRRTADAMVDAIGAL